MIGQETKWYFLPSEEEPYDQISQPAYHCYGPKDNGWQLIVDPTSVYFVTYSDRDLTQEELLAKQRAIYQITLIQGVLNNIDRAHPYVEMQGGQVIYDVGELVEKQRFFTRDPHAIPFAPWAYAASEELGS